MAKEFKSLKAFAKHIRGLVEKFPVYEKKAADFLGNILELEAKYKIGYLQPSAGPFAAWAPLAESTKRDKERLGYVFKEDYNPEYRTGEMRDSISFSFIPAKHLLLLGSPSQILLWQEEGTRYMPARSIIGATMYQAPAAINHVMGNMLKDWICGIPLKLTPIFYNLPTGQHGGSL